MTRLSARVIALVALLILPAVAHAQKEPAHTKETKNVEKFVGLAMTRQDAAQKRPFYEQALPSVREAISKDPENGRVWLLAGVVYTGLGQFAAADSAFDRAADLYPPYAEEISGERHAAWEMAFNNAVALINEQKFQEGVRALEEAELIFDERPEAKYYLGLFYMQEQQLDKAEKAFNDAIAAVNGPLRPKLQQPAVEEWDRLAVNARIKLSNLYAFRGAAQYDRQQYDSAAVTFAKARSIATPGRDHLFNLLQSRYAQVLQLDKQRAEKKSPDLDKQAQDLYTQVISLTDTLRTIDPLNEDIFFFSSRAHKVLSELTREPAAKTRHMSALSAINAEYEKLNFVITDVQIAEADTTATVSGNVVNRLLKPGVTGSITFELVGLDGTVIGSAPINFTAPAGAAADTKIPFNVTIPMNGALAGWRYRVE